MAHVVIKDLALIAVPYLSSPFRFFSGKKGILLGGSVYGTDLNGSTCVHPCIRVAQFMS